MTPVRVIADSRELRSGVVRALESLGAELSIETLDVGDYVISDRCAFERKDIDDFMKSWLDEKKLFGQIGDLARSYERPILIIEGGDPFFSGRQVHPRAVNGVMNTIARSFRLPILYSLNPKETAEIIFMNASREQCEDTRQFSPHGKRSHLSFAKQQEYVVSAISDVGPVAAKNLLKHFGSIEKIMTAGGTQLQEIDGIGPKIAGKIRALVSATYVLDKEDHAKPK